ncbi:hypothetical protein CJF30_00011248 [Rutstroemia sp. NJR-2017a BBW]|nr:hypothetical protein CJF30_00011248 [Rutstroemia sp. NJR-2017a BBW]
MKSFIRKRRRL